MLLSDLIAHASERLTPTERLLAEAVVRDPTLLAFGTVSDLAGKPVKRSHDLGQPQGVRGRNSDNTRLRQALEWVPQVSLERGLEKTYQWILEQLRADGRLP